MESHYDPSLVGSEVKWLQEIRNIESTLNTTINNVNLSLGNIDTNVSSILPKLDTIITLLTNIYNLLIPYTQVFSNSTTWVVTHNKGTYPVVTTIDSSGNIIYGSVVYNNLNTVTITFNTPQSGTAICTV